MNLLLLEPDEIGPGQEARLTDRRLTHAREVLRAQAGQTLKVGIVGGLMGTAEVLTLSETELRLTVHATLSPPPRAGVSLILAIPRPKALKRIIPAVASLGVDRLVLVNAARVEKSYFDSKVLASAFLDELVRLGLEQACDTVCPVIEVRQRLTPFCEDELDAWAPAGAMRLIPHPLAAQPIHPAPPNRQVVLAIGPDGGWVPHEIDLFTRCGFTPVSMGPRVLRGEVALPAVFGAVRAAVERAI